jgi:hypothetical protein
MMCNRISVISFFIPVLSLLLQGSFASAQGLDNPAGAVEVTNDPQAPPPPTPTPKVGRKAAEKYMAPRGRTAGAASNSASADAKAVGPDDHYLAVHLGGFLDDKA